MLRASPGGAARPAEARRTTAPTSTARNGWDTLLEGRTTTGETLPTPPAHVNARGGGGPSRTTRLQGNGRPPPAYGGWCPQRPRWRRPRGGLQARDVGHAGRRGDAFMMNQPVGMSFIQPKALGVMRGWLPGGWERFRHGFSQFVLAFQAIHRDSLAWKRYLRTCTLQAVVALALGALFLLSARHSSEGLREERVRRALQNVTVVQSQDSAPDAPTPPEVQPSAPQRRRTSAKSKPAAAAAASTGAQDEAGVKDSAADAAQAKAEFQRKLHKLEKAFAELSLKAGPTAVRRDKDFQEAREDLDEQLSGLEEDAADVPLTAEQKATLVRLGAELDVLEQKTKPGCWDSAWALA